MVTGSKFDEINYEKFKKLASNFTQSRQNQNTFKWNEKREQKLNLFCGKKKWIKIHKNEQNVKKWKNMREKLISNIA